MPWKCIIEVVSSRKGCHSGLKTIVQGQKHVNLSCCTIEALWGKELTYWLHSNMNLYSLYISNFHCILKTKKCVQLLASFFTVSIVSYQSFEKTFPIMFSFLVFPCFYFGVVHQSVVLCCTVWSQNMASQAKDMTFFFSFYYVLQCFWSYVYYVIFVKILSRSLSINSCCLYQALC